MKRVLFLRLQWSFKYPASFEGIDDENFATFREISDQIEQISVSG